VSRTRVCGGTHGALHSSKMEGALYCIPPTEKCRLDEPNPHQQHQPQRRRQYPPLALASAPLKQARRGRASRREGAPPRSSTDKYRNADWKTQTKRTYPSRPVGGSPDPAFILLNSQQSFIKTNSVLSGVLYCKLCISSHVHFLSLAAPLFWAPVPCPGFPSRSFPRPGSGFRKRVAQKPGNGKQKNGVEEKAKNAQR